MNQGEFQLKDERFWEASDAVEEALVERFKETDFMGLALDGPRALRLDQHETVPLLGVRACSIRDNISRSLQRQAVLVASRLDGTQTLAATAFRQPDEPQRLSDPRDPAKLPKGRTVKAFNVSLADRMPELPWKPGTWQTTVLLYDQRSNAVITRLEEAPSRDPAVLEFLTAQRRPAFPPAVSPPLDAGTNPYLPRPDSPSAPAGPGIVLTVDRVAVHGPGRSCVLRGSFRLPILPRDMVKHLPGPVGSEAERLALADGWLDVGDDEAIAVLPVALLLTGNQRAEPLLIPLHVPIYGPLEAKDTSAGARGFFAVDLFRLLPEDLLIQSYAVWAVSRSVLSDPVLLGLVTESMVPAAGE
jgi:hypothetical protein